jgi:hypothetical protein
LVLTLDVPDWVSTAHAGHPDERSNIEYAILASLDASLEHIRRNTPLIAGPDRPEFARGVAACGVLDVDKGSPDGRGGPHMRARVLVVGVERNDGTLLEPDAPVVADPDVFEQANRLARARLVEELGALGYAENALERRAQPRTWVGRNGVWVHDPFDEYRHLVRGRVKQFEDELVLKGEELANSADADLRSRRDALSGAFDSLDRDRLAESARWDPYFTSVRAELHRALEEGAVLEGRLRDAEASPNLHAAAETVIEWTRDLESAQPDEVLSEMLMSAIGRDPQAGRELTHEQWSRAVELVAILREEAIRKAERAGRTQERPPDAQGVGCGEISEAMESERAREHQFREELGLPGSARPIGREEIRRPRFLEELAEAIGEDRARMLANRAEPLEAWLAQQPDDLIAQRFAELGDPQAFLDRRAGRFCLVHEQRAAADPDYQQDDPYLRDWFAADGDRAGRALAYATELYTREKLEIALGAARAEIDPPPHVTRHIGPRTDIEEWRVLARDLEAAHLGARADQRCGRDWHVPDREHEAELHRRVDRLREKLSLEPRMAAAALEPEIGSFGIDGP